jgi:16S rRNA (adenine1518-N6/adenine1519-N6)-dimethyltransferase
MVMSLLMEVKHLLKQYNIKPKKRLGQNFVVCNSLISKMVDSANIGSDDIVLEVGAGLGFLTRKIAERARKVIAVEIDAKLVNILKSLLKDFENINIIHADVLKLNINNVDKIVSNVPFNISSPLLFKMAQEISFKLAVLTLQKEFVDRMLAQPGSKDYGRLSVTSNFFFQVDFLGNVSRRCFYPQPEVDISLIRLIPKNTFLKNNLILFFLDFVRIIFTCKNKKLKNALDVYFRFKNVSEKMHNDIMCKIPFMEKRVIELDINELYMIASLLYDQLNLNF